MKRALIWLSLIGVVTAGWMVTAVPYFARTQFEILIGDPRVLAARCETDDYPPEGKDDCRAHARDVARNETEMRTQFWWGAVRVASGLAVAMWILIALGATATWLAIRFIRIRRDVRAG